MVRAIKSLTQTKTIGKQLNKLFLNFRNVPDSLANLLLCIEIGTLIILSDRSISNYLYNSFETYNQDSIVTNNSFMLVQIIVIIIIQLWLDVSLVRIVYLRCFYAFRFNDVARYVLISLAAASLAIDFCKNSTGLVYFRNKWAESYNEIKLIIYFCNIAAVLSLRLHVDIVCPILTAMYFFLYILRLKFPMFNESTNVYSEILLLFGFLISLLNTIDIFLVTIELHYKALSVLILFCIHSFIKIRFFSNNIKECLIQIQQMHKQDIFVKNMTLILIYFENYVYTQSEGEKLKQFIFKYTNIELPILSSKTRLQYIKGIYQLTVSQSDRYKDSLHFWVFLAQLEMAANNNIVGLIKIVGQLESKVKYNIRTWITKIQLDKVQQFLRYTLISYSRNYRRHVHAEVMMQGFLENVHFVETTILSTQAYYDLWSCLVDGIQSRGELDRRLDKLINITQAVQTTYESISLRSKHSCLLYYNYLKLVHKDKQLQRVVGLDWECSKSVTEDCMMYEQSIFICLSLSGEILQIGQNSLGLLQFDQNQLLNYNISRIIPKFCKTQQHQFIKHYVSSIQHRQNQQDQKVNICSLVIDSNQHLRGTKMDLNLYLVDGQLRLAGSLTIDKNLKNIIAFKGTGEIISTSSSLHGCDSKMIQEQNKVQIQEILQNLQTNQVVELSVIVNYGIISDTYSLIRYIPQQTLAQSIFVIGNTKYDLPERNIQVYPTMHKSIRIFQKQLTPKEEVDLVDAMKQQYTQKYKPIRVFIRCTLLIVSILITLGITLYFHHIVRQRSNQKLNYSQMMKIFQISSLQTLHFAGSTFYLGMTYDQGVSLSSVNHISVPEIQKYVASVRKSLLILNSLPQPLTTQNFPTLTFQTKSLLVVSTIAVIYDYILMDIRYYDPKRFIKLVEYTQMNLQELVKNLIPMYQTQIMKSLSVTVNFYNIVYTISLVFTLLLSITQAIAIIVFNRRYKVEVLHVINVIIQMTETELNINIRNLEKYKNIVYCINKLERSKTTNLEEFSNQFDKDGGLFLISASLQATQRELIGAMSPMPSFTPLNSSHNQSTFKCFNPDPQALESQNKKTRSVRKHINIPVNYFLYAITLILSIGLCVNFGMYYSFSKDPSYSSILFIQSIAGLKKTFFAYEILHGVLFQNVYSGYKYMDLFQEALQNYSLSTSSLKLFDQSLFNGPQFQHFRAYKKQFDFAPICSYIDCQLYKNQMNSSYMTSVFTSVGIIQKIYNQTLISPVSVEELVSDYNLDFLIYADMIYMQIYVELFNAAFENLATHIYKISQISMIRMSVQYGILFLFLIVGVVLIVYFMKERRRTLMIIRILRQQNQAEVKF